MSRKSLDDILQGVDEPEESLDTEQPAAEVKAEAVETDEADGDDLDEPEKTAATQDKPSDKAAKEEGEDKKDGLPPWMHARVKSATEAKTAAERERDEMARKLQEWESWYEQNQQTQQGQTSIHDVIQNTVGQALSTYEQRQAQADWNRRVNESHLVAAEKFGEDVAQNAAAWAAERAAYDPNFAAAIRSHPQPTVFSVQEFNKAQAYVELDRYGGDIDKLIEAKLAERGQIQTDPPASPQVAQSRKMPGNFSGSPSAQSGRSGPAFSGPTPLSELLK